MLQVVIVGAGPAGLYAAERLLKGGAAVTVLDRLPAPFGLVRYGVAADHQTTKMVDRVLGRVFQKGASFLGGVELGRDVTLAALRQSFDAVVLATGAPRERRLGIAGEETPGVLSSAAFTGWLNGHPDHAGCPLPESAIEEAVIVGAGNVALDVARLLAKRGEELTGSDLSPEAGERLAALPLRRVTLLARRGPDAVRFTPHELGEFGQLAQARPRVDPDALPPLREDEDEVMVLLRRYAEPAAAKPLEIRFRFNAVPQAFLAEAGRLTAIEIATPAGSERLPAQLAVTCIGYSAPGFSELAAEDGRFANEAGRIAEGLYVAGWAGRGPSGTIPTNRAESHAVADRLLSEVAEGGKPGMAAFPEALRSQAWSFDDWQALDAAEKAAAGEGRVRRKVARWEELAAFRKGR